MHLFALLISFCTLVTFSAVRVRIVGESQAKNRNADIDLLLMRTCVAQLAEKWPPFPTEADDHAVARQELLTRSWQLKDQLDSLVFANRLDKMFSEKRGDLDKEIKGVEDQLKALQFDPDAAMKRCQDGNMPLADECLQRHIASYAEADGLQGKSLEMSKLAIERLRLEDWLAHKAALSKSQVDQHSNRREEIKVAFWTSFPHFRFSEARATCRKEALELVREPILRVINEMTSVIDDSTTCMEKVGEMCPEGTMPEVNRQTDVAKGTKIATRAGVALQVGKTVLGGAIGGLTAGPIGFAAGLAKGATAGFLFPGTVPLVGAAFAWGSRGEKECACFPRECRYDEQIQACRIGTDEDSPSNNPFSSTVPYLSTKCAQIGNSSQPKCEIKKCEEKDYEPSLQSSLGHQLFGSVGAHGADVFNCLSTNGRSTGALPLQVELWTGKTNTAKTRAEIFQSLNIVEQAAA